MSKCDKINNIIIILIDKTRIDLMSWSGAWIGPS
jgi:hypothetical protein